MGVDTGPGRPLVIHGRSAILSMIDSSMLGFLISILVAVSIMAGILVWLG